MRFLAPMMAVAAMAAPVLAAPDAHPAKLVGEYDGGQMEIASALQLTKDGRFQYMLSYGALDEYAAGTWTAESDAVMLVVEKYESNDPSGDGKFGPSILKTEDGVLTISRYDRTLRFRKR